MILPAFDVAAWIKNNPSESDKNKAAASGSGLKVAGADGGRKEDEGRGGDDGDGQGRVDAQARAGCRGGGEAAAKRTTRVAFEEHNHRRLDGARCEGECAGGGVERHDVERRYSKRARGRRWLNPTAGAQRHPTVIWGHDRGREAYHQRRI